MLRQTIIIGLFSLASLNLVCADDLSDQGSVYGHGGPTGDQSQACDAAKANAQTKVHQDESVAAYGSCECHQQRTSAGAPVWLCDVAATWKKRDRETALMPDPNVPFRHCMLNQDIDQTAWAVTAGPPSPNFPGVATPPDDDGGGPPVQGLTCAMVANETVHLSKEGLPLATVRLCVVVRDSAGRTWRVFHTNGACLHGNEGRMGVDDNGQTLTPDY